MDPRPATPLPAAPYAPPGDVRAGIEAESVLASLHAEQRGMLEVLVLADTRGVAGGPRAARLFTGLVGEEPRAAVDRRRRLAGLGLLRRAGITHRITPLGRQALGAHAAEVLEIRKRIEDLLEEEREADLARADILEVLLDAGEDDDAPGPLLPEEACGRAIPPVPARPGPRACASQGLTVDRVRAHAAALSLPEGVIERAVAALASDKHLLLVGPPGTGKTELALAIGEAAKAEGLCQGVLTATASGDWTTYDTIGGYAVGPGGALRFRPGVFLSAIERRSWLLVDELNRADVDRAFGELLTVLAGRDASAPFELPDGCLVTVGPSAGATYRVPSSFRMLATMNSWDRAALFRLSYAMQRRFAVVHVGAPEDAAYARLLAQHAREGGAPSLDPRALASLGRLFSAAGILAHRPIGPAIALDMVRYLRRRGAPEDSLAEAFAMYLLPQLEGLSPGVAASVWTLLAAELGAASPRARDELRARFRELFPSARVEAA